jgi:hypothetical protein
LNKHNAPSVTYPLKRSRVQAAVLVGFWLLGCTAVCSWLYASQNRTLSLPVGIAVLGLTGWAAFSGWKSSPLGELVWDGQSWRWESAGYQTGVTEYQVMVAADFQQIVLLRLENPANARLWLWVECTALPERWLDLRRAVYSPHRERAFQVTVV